MAPKVIYIRLAIMIHLDGNVSSFALVSKQKLRKMKLNSIQKGSFLYQVFVVYWIGHWSFTQEVWVQFLVCPLLLFLLDLLLLCLFLPFKISCHIKFAADS